MRYFDVDDLVIADCFINYARADPTGKATALEP